MEIESNVERERALARALLDFKTAHTRLAMMLDLPTSELLMLAGVVEQAKTEGMKVKAPKAKVSKEIVRRKVAKKAPALTVGSDVLDVPILDNSLTVTIGKKREHMVVAAARLIVEKGPLTIPEMLEAMKEKGWKLNSKSEFTYQIVRGLLVRQAKFFKTINKDGSRQFALRNMKPQAKAKSGVRVRKEAKTDLRDQVLRTLSRVKEPITTPALAERLGLSSGQGLVPLLVSLKEHGAVKKVVRDDITHWDPNRDKLKSYDAERGGAAFTQKHVEALNGVSHA